MRGTKVRSRSAVMIRKNAAKLFPDKSETTGSRGLRYGGIPLVRCCQSNVIAQAAAKGKARFVNPTPIIAVTMGDPAGIGPEVCLKAIAPWDVAQAVPVIFGDADVLRRTSLRGNLPLPEVASELNRR